MTAIVTCKIGFAFALSPMSKTTLKIFGALRHRTLAYLDFTPFRFLLSFSTVNGQPTETICHLPSTLFINQKSSALPPWPPSKSNSRLLYLFLRFLMSKGAPRTPQLSRSKTSYVPTWTTHVSIKAIIKLYEDKNIDGIQEWEAKLSLKKKRGIVLLGPGKEYVYFYFTLSPSKFFTCIITHPTNRLKLQGIVISQYVLKHTAAMGNLDLTFTK